MTREQVNQELTELRKLLKVNCNALTNDRCFELRDKYEMAINQLETIDQLIYQQRILFGKTIVQVSRILYFSESGVTKRWSKITKQLVEILTKPKTNFDRITESADAFVEWLFESNVNEHCTNSNCKTTNRMDCKKCFIEWLQEECEQ